MDDHDDHDDHDYYYDHDGHYDYYYDHYDDDDDDHDCSKIAVYSNLSQAMCNRIMNKEIQCSTYH